MKCTPFANEGIIIITYGKAGTDRDASSMSGRNEDFYVIMNSTTRVALLAKYCVNPDNLMQANLLKESLNDIIDGKNISATNDYLKYGLGSASGIAWIYYVDGQNSKINTWDCRNSDGNY